MATIAEYHDLDPGGDVYILLQKNDGDVEENSKVSATYNAILAESQLKLTSTPL